MTARPFLKSVGGKTQLLPLLREHTPKSFREYHEPFVGGGAFYFDLVARGYAGTAHLTDANDLLINAYKRVRDELPAILAELKVHAENHSSDYYYAQRALGFPKRVGAIEAARYIYFSKTCFNGVWRVNRSGGFNVPIGSYKNPVICDEENLTAVSRALQHSSRLMVGDFSEVRPKAGDFVYCDPPYVPVGGEATFTEYTAGGFGPEKQTRLRDYALQLKRQGVHILLSNADVPFVHELYYGDFEMRHVEARRAINSDTKKRGKVGEVLIW
jgi:DNA adenine methylase